VTPAPCLPSRLQASRSYVSPLRVGIRASEITKEIGVERSSPSLSRHLQDDRLGVTQSVHAEGHRPAWAQQGSARSCRSTQADRNVGGSNGAL